MPFTDPVVAQDELIREAIRSSNYSAGQSGWRIGADGTAEFTGMQINVSGSGDGIIMRHSDTGLVVGAVTELGAVCGTSVSCTTDQLDVRGKRLDRRIAEISERFTMYGRMNMLIQTATEVALFEICIDVIGYSDPILYEFSCGMACYTSNGSPLVGLRIRDGGYGIPTTSSTLLAERNQPGPGAAYMGFHPQAGGFISLTPGRHRLLLSACTYNGNIVVCSGEAFLGIKEIKAYTPNMALQNNGTTIVPANPKLLYETEFPATWTASYDGARNHMADKGTALRQGWESEGRGNQRAMIGFDYAEIQSYLTGATIISSELLMYATAWENNEGSCSIGTHNEATQPAMYPTLGVIPSREGQLEWATAARRLCGLDQYFMADLVGGAAKGIVLEAPYGSELYSGQWSGVGGLGDAWPPTLVVRYVK
jgi:hypothetical protein